MQTAAPRPRKLQTRASDDQRAEVEALRRIRQPFWREGMTATGPKECPNAASVGLSRAPVARTHKSKGLSPLSAPDPRPEILRSEKETPAEMIHTDIKNGAMVRHWSKDNSEAASGDR